ncbi:unnamed protein product [Camellia sinensis]
MSIKLNCVLIELDLPIVPLSDFDFAEVPFISKALSGASVIDLKITTTEEDLIVVLPSRKDLVAGSAHCALAGYWSEKLGKCDFVAYQLEVVY